MPPQLEKNNVVPTAWQDEALARDGVSREVPCSALPHWLEGRSVGVSAVSSDYAAAETYLRRRQLLLRGEPLISPTPEPESPPPTPLLRSGRPFPSSLEAVWAGNPSQEGDSLTWTLGVP